jgi:hypothetical protein
VEHPFFFSPPICSQKYIIIFLQKAKNMFKDEGVNASKLIRFSEFTQIRDGHVPAEAE